MTTTTLGTSKQGGGAFTVDKPKTKPKKKKRASKPKTAPKPVVAVNYNGEYRARFVLVRDFSENPCWSGNRKFKIQNNSASLAVVPLLGETLGGKVSGGTLTIFTAKRGILDPWQWSGSVKLPAARQAVGIGRLQGRSKEGDGCDWRLEVTRLN